MAPTLYTAIALVIPITVFLFFDCLKVFVSVRVEKFGNKMLFLFFYTLHAVSNVFLLNSTLEDSLSGW